MKTTLTNISSMTLANSVRTGSMVTLLAAAGAVQTAHAGGIVGAWGDNWLGQRNVPTDLGACTAVAGGQGHIPLTYRAYLFSRREAVITNPRGLAKGFRK